MNILISMVSLILVIVIMKILKLKFPNMANVILAGIGVTVMVIILNTVFKSLVPEMWLNLGGILSLVYYFIYAGVFEEVAKLIGLKLSKPKNNSQILTNALLIACLFGVYENIGYLSMDLSTKSLIFRMVNMHLLFQVIMANIIVSGAEKNQKGLFTIIALAVAIVVHTLWDYGNSHTIIKVLGAIICYAGVVYTLIRAKKIQDTLQPTEDTKDKLFIVKIIVIVIFTAFYIFAFTTGDGTRSKLNDTCSIDYIDIKVIEAKEVEIENEKAIKIKLSLKNNSDKEVDAISWNSLKIVDLDTGEFDLESLSFSLYDDSKRLDSKVEPNSENVGYVFFKAKKDIKKYKLTYENKEIKENATCNMSLN